MSGLADRLGIPASRIEPIPGLEGPVLPPPEELFERAFETAPDDPEAGQILLAAAILARSQQTTEGRLTAGLALLAQLVANADPMMTLGPPGHRLREELMPGGWDVATKHWRRFRYAWREGLAELLGVGNAPRAPGPTIAPLEEWARYGEETSLVAAPEGRQRRHDATVQALDELTRLSPAEPEPVPVSIQESFPEPRIAFMFSAIGILLGIRTFIKEVRPGLAQRK